MSFTALSSDFRSTLKATSSCWNSERTWKIFCPNCSAAATENMAAILPATFFAIPSSFSPSFAACVPTSLS